jgi:hypothetical protein
MERCPLPEAEEIGLTMALVSLSAAHMRGESSRAYYISSVLDLLIVYGLITAPDGAETSP